MLSRLACAAATASFGAALWLAAPTLVSAQTQQQTESQTAAAPPLAPPKPYEKVRVVLAPPLPDAALDAFRKQVAAVAARQDRNALAKMVAKNFFWERGPRIQGGQGKSAIEKLADAIGLDEPDGWQFLAGYASEPSISQAPGRDGLVCAPATPQFDRQQFESLVKDTATDPFEWGYPTQTDIDVHETKDGKSKVMEKLGLYFVRAFPDEVSDSSDSTLRIVTPTGKVGYVDVNALLPLGADQLCYKKEGGGWKLGAYIGQDTGE